METRKIKLTIGESDLKALVDILNGKYNKEIKKEVLE